MIIIGCDYHPGFQQIAFVDTETGDYGEQRLEHSEGAEKFYRDLAAQGKKVRVGMEASGHARWFERLLAEPVPSIDMIQPLFRKNENNLLAQLHRTKTPRSTG